MTYEFSLSSRVTTSELVSRSCFRLDDAKYSAGWIAKDSDPAVRNIDSWHEILPAQTHRLLNGRCGICDFKKHIPIRRNFFRHCRWAWKKASNRTPICQPLTASELVARQWRASRPTKQVSIEFGYSWKIVCNEFGPSKCAEPICCACHLVFALSSRKLCSRGVCKHGKAS